MCTYMYVCMCHTHLNFTIYIFEYGHLACLESSCEFNSKGHVIYTRTYKIGPFSNSAEDDYASCLSHHQATKPLLLGQTSLVNIICCRLQRQISHCHSNDRPMNQCCANRWLGQSLAVDVSGCLKPRRCHRQLRRSIWAASKQSCDIIDAESVRSHALPIERRSCVAMIASVAAAALQLSAPVATTAKTPANVPFVKLPSGLRVQDIV
jgi:hypothetical protein